MVDERAGNATPRKYAPLGIDDAIAHSIHLEDAASESGAGEA
jgi:hypothetical protein